MAEPDREVRGITAELAQEFHPDQWVNVYQFDPELGDQKLCYRGRCQIKHLTHLMGNLPLDQFALEPLNHEGQVISVQQAFDNEAKGEV
jgi:hypothetical protein